MLGIVSISTAGVIGLALLLSQIVYYKLRLLGPELLFGSATAAVIMFLLASVFFFNYSKFFIKPDWSDPHIPRQTETTTPTNKLFNDPPFEAASVTEHSTELLKRK